MNLSSKRKAVEYLHKNAKIDVTGLHTVSARIDNANELIDGLIKLISIPDGKNNEEAVCSNCKSEGSLLNAKYCPNCGSIELTDC